MNRELDDDAKLDFLGEGTIKGNFPDDTARIAEMLATRDGLDKIVKGFDNWIGKYFEDESIVSFKTKENDPVEVMGAVYRLIDEPLHFESNPDFEQQTSQFVTQDEIDAVLIGRGSGTESGTESGKYRIYGYFLQDYTTNEKAAFLREEYGWGGYGYTGFNETHSGSGLHISHGDIFEPYDKVSLPWAKVAERIDTLIADGRYMSQQELDAIPSYEKRELAGEIYRFFDSRPADADILRP